MTSLGAPRPPALDGALALAEGSSHKTGSFLAPEVQAWLASPEQGVTAAIESVRGADATADALARLSPSSLTVVATALTDRACWAEITRRGEAEPETCVAGLTYDAAGAVSRLVWLRAPLVQVLQVDDGPDAPDARSILEKYFADLMRSRFREAAAHFTVDALYSHPPYAGGTERVLYRGREALWRGFVTAPRVRLPGTSPSTATDGFPVPASPGRPRAAAAGHALNPLALEQRIELM